MTDPMLHSAAKEALSKTPMDHALELRHITFGYQGHPAVHHVDLTIARGDLVAITGPNGSGKSTLLKGIAGTLKPLSGHVDLGRLSARDVAYMPQTSEIDRAFPISVIDFVALGLWRQTKFWGGRDAGQRTAIADAISKVGLQGFENRLLSTLSGGQVQRALFARAVVQDSELILLDEPFTGIDAKTTADLLSLLQSWPAEGRTVLAVLHDLEAVRQAFPLVLLLARKVVAFGAPDAVLTPENIAAARAMSERWDDAAPWCEEEAHAGGADT